jgi:hypothetical protein
MLQFTQQPTNLSQSGLREPLFVGLGQKDGFEGRRLRKRVSLSYLEDPWFAMIYIARIQAPLLKKTLTASFLVGGLGFSRLLSLLVSSVRK